MDGLTDKPRDICNNRVAYVTENTELICLEPSKKKKNGSNLSTLHMKNMSQKKNLLKLVQMKHVL